MWSRAGRFTPSESYTLKAEYPYCGALLDGPRKPGPPGPLIASLNAMLGSPDYQLTPEQIQAIADGWRFWRREPERSRRVIRLAIANWLAYYDLPPDRRPEPDPSVSGPFDFYAFGPEAPANARTLSPEALDRWLRRAIDAQAIARRAGTSGRSAARERAEPPGAGGPAGERALSPRPRDRSAVRRGAGRALLKDLPDDGLEEAGREPTPEVRQARNPGIDRAGAMTMTTDIEL